MGITLFLNIVTEMSLLSNNYIANAPSNSALLAGGRSLVRLALDAQVHDVIAANSTVIHNDIWKRNK